MKAVDFYKLPRSIQDRFVGSVMSGFPPAPLLANKGGTKTKIFWLGISAACFVAVVVTTRLGYGSLDSGLSLHSWKALPLYLAFVFGIAFGLLQAFARVVRERALPYGAGVYLFPACLIDARSESFKIYDTKDLSGVEAQGGAIKVSFAGGSSFLFPLADPASGVALVTEVNTARDRAMRANATEDLGELVAVDPLHNPRFSSPVGPRDPYAMRLPPWGKLGAAVAGVVCVAFGPTIWAFRNNGSDKTMYAHAVATNDTASYQAYLAHGEKFKDEVAGKALPRAELRDAERAGTVEALLKYKADHPSSQIGDEVALSIRTAMLAELEKAKAPGTLGALQEFAKKFPEHGVEPELKEAMHAVYTRELDGYKKRAPNKEKTVVPFVERLFAYAEKHGSKVEVRFRRKKSESLGRSDQYIAKQPNFGGEVSYPTRYFDDKHSAKREAILGKTLTTRLDAGLSPELFQFEIGAVVPAEAENLPDVKVPTLFVSHVVEWTGIAYNSQRPRGSFAGLNYTLEATWVIPGDTGKPLKYKFDIYKHAMLGVLHEGDELPPPGVAEERVYEAMSESVFDQWGEKFLALFFKAPDKDKDAPKAPAP